MMKRFEWGFRCVVLCTALSLLMGVVSGCSRGGYSGPTGTVAGAVTHAGQPVPAGCRVSFVSAEGFVASGEVGAGGAYTLSVVENPNIPVATYRATISPPPERELSEAEYEAAMAKGLTGTEDRTQSAIPEKYQSLEASGLSFEVKEGPNKIDITLE
jgi:hypothetical protein